MLHLFFQRLKLTLDQWSISREKTNEPGSLKEHLGELLAAGPMLRRLTGDAIYAQRPLLDLLQSHECDDLFPVKGHQPEMLEALKACFADASPDRSHHQRSGANGVSKKRATSGSIWPMPIISANA